MTPTEVYNSVRGFLAGERSKQPDQEQPRRDRRGGAKLELPLEALPMLFPVDDEITQSNTVEPFPNKAGLNVPAQPDTMASYSDGFGAETIDASWNRAAGVIITSARPGLVVDAGIGVFPMTVSLAGPWTKPTVECAIGAYDLAGTFGIFFNGTLNAARQLVSGYVCKYSQTLDTGYAYRYTGGVATLLGTSGAGLGAFGTVLGLRLKQSGASTFFEAINGSGAIGIDGGFGVFVEQVYTSGACGFIFDDEGARAISFSVAHP